MSSLPIQSLTRNVFSNWLVLAASIAYALVITPIVVRTLDTELYGVWSFLNAILAYGELLYLGLGVAFVKFVAQNLARSDDSGLRRLVRVIATMYWLQGGVGLALLVWLGMMLPSVFASPLSSEATDAAALTCVLLGVRVLLLFISSVYSGLLWGYERFDVVSLVRLGGIAARFIATPLALEAGRHPLLTMAWIAAAVAAGEVIAMRIAARRTMPGLSVQPVMPQWPELGRLYRVGLGSAFVILAIKLIAYTDTTVTGMMLGASSVALISLPLQLVEYGRLVIAGFVEVLLPRIETLSTRRDLPGLRAAYLQTSRVACFLAGWLVSLIVTIGPAFLNRWVGPEYGTPVQWVLTFLGAAMFGQVLSAQMPLAFYQALHKLTVPAIVLLIEAVLNVGLSVWLAPSLGLSGVALASAVTAFGVGVVVLPPYLCRQLQLPITEWLTRGVAPGVLMLATTIVLQLAIDLVFASDAYSAIVIRVVSTVPVALVIVRWTFPERERRIVWDRLRRLALL